MIDITSLVRSAVKRSGIGNGVAWVYVPHTTAGVTIQENADPTVKSDLLAHVARLIPKDGGFQHAEGNADAHIKSSLFGASQAHNLERFGKKNLRGYRIYRSTDGATWNQLGTTTFTTFTNTHLKGLSSVRFYVLAYDKAGNTSAAAPNPVISLGKNQCS